MSANEKDLLEVRTGIILSDKAKAVWNEIADDMAAQFDKDDSKKTSVKTICLEDGRLIAADAGINSVAEIIDIRKNANIF